MPKRVLIVGTVPYNRNATSRAFDSYFHNYPKENLAQIFSNPNKPLKGHAKTLFQITDHEILKNWFERDADIGTIFNYDDLKEEAEGEEFTADKKIKLAYKIGARHTAFTHLMRGILWREKFWETEKLEKWLDEFRPECVFLSFSDDYFILKIALYVAKKYNIPIVSCISDDYYFDNRFSLSPFYHIYKKTYKALVREVLEYTSSAVYISDKIKNKYNKEFSLSGDTVYLTSEINRREFSYIDINSPKITYFGNIRMGRNTSLCDIAQALYSINPNYKLQVFSNEKDKKYYSVFKKYPSINFCGSVPYDELEIKMLQSDITIIAEGFKDKDISQSRYSLSTKVADIIKSGVSLLCYGSVSCGTVEYIKSQNVGAVCAEKENLKAVICELISDKALQRKYYDNSAFVYEKNHNLEKSCAIVEELIEKAEVK